MKIYFTQEGGAYIKLPSEDYLCIGKGEAVKKMSGDEIQQAIREAVILAHFNALTINKQTTLH